MCRAQRRHGLPDHFARHAVDEGPRIYIERINIVGNAADEGLLVIRRDFRSVQGDAYNPLLVDSAKKRLEALGIFKKVEVRCCPGLPRIASCWTSR